MTRRHWFLLGAIESFIFASLVLTITLLDSHLPKSLYAVVIVFVGFGFFFFICRWAEKWWISEEEP